MDKVKTGLANYYGEVKAIKKDDKYFLCLDCYDKTNSKEISEELYLAIQKEFA